MSEVRPVATLLVVVRSDDVLSFDCNDGSWTARSLSFPRLIVNPAPLAVPTPSLTYLDAAEKVLDETKARTPISHRAITTTAIDMGYLVSGGITPEQTMYVQLMTDVKR